MICHANCPECFRVFDGFRNVFIAARFAIRDLPQCRPDAFLKRRSVQPVRKIKRFARPCKIFVQLPKYQSSQLVRHVGFCGPTKTRIGQLTEEGHYTGGMIPYGYRPINRGRTNKRNKEVYDLEIVPDEAEIVRLIFQKCVFEGYGAQRLCNFLSEQGIRNQRGGNIPTTTINRILKNVLYTGIISNGESKSEPIEELRIVDDDIFRRAQEVLEKRKTHHNEVPLNTRGQSLLVGNIYCGHCGGRLTLTTSGRKYVRKDGTVRREVPRPLSMPLQQTAPWGV